MKKSELKKMVSEYQNLKLRLNKPNLQNTHALLEKLGEIKHRYFHETGNDIELDLKSSTLSSD